MTAHPASTRPVRETWQALVPEDASAEAFTRAMISSLPEAAQRQLLHAIEPGAPLWRSVELQIRGEIKIGSWRRFTARQILTPAAGFVWAATARFYGLPVSGYDRYAAGIGAMRWRLLGVVPVVTATAEDVTRSAAGRLAAESPFFVPTTFDLAVWAEGPTTDVARCTWHVDGNDDTVELRVAPDGALQAVVMQRWKDGGLRVPFGVHMHAEHRFAGVTIPVRFTGWWETPGDGDFFRGEITAATFR